MQFHAITEKDKVHPGEYVLHLPTHEIVLCGSFNRAEDKIRGMRRGRLFEDKISNFQKIVTTGSERRDMRASSCKGCSG